MAKNEEEFGRLEDEERKTSTNTDDKLSQLKLLNASRPYLFANEKIPKITQSYWKKSIGIVY